MIKVTREFLHKFDTVMSYYECDDAEIELAKQAVRDDFEEVSKSYDIIYENISAIRDRIKSSGVEISLSDIYLDTWKKDYEEKPVDKKGKKKVQSNFG